MKQWKLFTTKFIHFKKDKITRQFVHLEGAVIFGDEPGQPLVVTESSDSCKYFDINARLLNYCEGRTLEYETNEKDKNGKAIKIMDGTVMSRVTNTRVDLNTYQGNSFGKTDYKFDKLEVK